MARNNDWQEKGIRIGGLVLSEDQSTELVTELRRVVEDPKIIEEIEQVLRGERKKLSEHTRDVLQIVAVGYVMRLDKRNR